MDGKKISFGFSKIKAKGSSLIQRKEVKQEVEYITSFDKNEKKPEVESLPGLVIPVKTNYTVGERIVAKKRKQEELSISDMCDENTSEIHSTGEQRIEKASPTPTEEKVSLESQAIRELLEDSNKIKQKSGPTMSIPMKSEIDEIEPASNIVDYDSVPVSQFGYAMLRGMGWAPGKGIGKNEKVVEVVDLTVRPRSLGLGAEYIPDRKTDSKDKKPEG